MTKSLWDFLLSRRISFRVELNNQGTKQRIPNSTWFLRYFVVKKFPRRLLWQSCAGISGADPQTRRVQSPDFRSALVAYIREQARPVDKFSHQPRLYELTRAVGAGQRYNDDVVFAAVWLHDLGVFVGHRPEEPEALAKWDCVAYALKRTPDILARLGFPAGKIPAVVEAIRTHQPQDNPTSIEGVIVRDADMLEQLGAVTVLRTVCKIGRDTRFKTFPDALGVLRKNADTLPDQLKLPTSRKLAAPRLQVLQQFLAAAQAEGCASPDLG